MESYPVVLEKPLPPPQRRILTGARRDPDDLPTPDPGTVLVFQVGGQYEEARVDGHLRGTEPNVVNATAVSVVNLRERVLPVELTLHSTRAADDFTAQVGFRCRVTRPATVAQAGLTDVTSLLASHLQEDDKLRTLTTGFPVEEINTVRRQVEARVRAYCMLSPPQLPGIDVALVSVDVLTPEDLRNQSKEVRDKHWQDEVQEVVHASEDKDVDRIAELIRQGPDTVAALALARGENRVAEILEHMLTERQQSDERMMEVTRILARDGHLDRLSVDAQAMVDTFLQRTTGAPIASSPPLPIDGKEDDPDQPAAAPDEHESKGPRDVPDEDDLAG